MTDMTNPDIDECACGSPDAAHGCLRDVLGDIQTAVGEIRDAALAPSSPLVFQLVPYVLVVAAWGWGIAEASGGHLERGFLHGALWPLSAAFLIARWLAGAP